MRCMQKCSWQYRLLFFKLENLTGPHERNGLSVLTQCEYRRMMMNTMNDWCTHFTMDKSQNIVEMKRSKLEKTLMLSALTVAINSGCYNNITTDWVACKQPECISYSSGGWKVQDYCACMTRFWYRHLPGGRFPTFHCDLTWKGPGPPEPL